MDTQDLVLESILTKIDAGHVTAADFNQLIQESTPEASRNRVRRRTKRTPTTSHVEPETGHQPLQPPTFNDRTMPKRKPLNQQSHGRSKIGHAHSAKTQARTGVQRKPQAHPTQRFLEAARFLQGIIGKDINEASNYADQTALRKVAAKLMSRPGINRDWLHDLLMKMGEIDGTA